MLVYWRAYSCGILGVLCNPSDATNNNYCFDNWSTKLNLPGLRSFQTGVQIKVLIELLMSYRITPRPDQHAN